MKPIIEISGSLGYKPERGYRAYICKGKGDMLFTSQVIDIRNETSDGVEIETQNTIYRLTYEVENAA